MYDDELEGNSDLEKDVKVLVSNMPSDTLFCEISEHDMCVDNVNDPAKQVSIDPSYQALFSKWQDDPKVLNVQKERIEMLMTYNHKLMSTVEELKWE